MSHSDVGVCVRVLSRFIHQQESGCLQRVSVQDGIIRQLGSFCPFGSAIRLYEGVRSGC